MRVGIALVFCSGGDGDSEWMRGVRRLDGMEEGREERGGRKEGRRGNETNGGLRREPHTKRILDPWPQLDPEEGTVEKENGGGWPAWEVGNSADCGRGNEGVRV